MRQDSVYRRLHLGLLSYEPDLDVSRLATSREIYCAGSTHPVRGKLKLDSLELDASGHWHHSCCYLSAFVLRQLVVLNLARPVPMLNDILETCLDLSYIRKITLYTQRFTSYTDSLHLTDNRRTSHIEFSVVFPDFAQLWPGGNESTWRHSTDSWITPHISSRRSQWNVLPDCFGPKLKGAPDLPDGCQSVTRFDPLSWPRLWTMDSLGRSCAVCSTQSRSANSLQLLAIDKTRCGDSDAFDELRAWDR